MTAFAFGEATMLVLGRVDARVRQHAAGAPVRRGSLETGSFEAGFFADHAKGECDRLLRIARAALDAGRRVRRSLRVEGRGPSAAERALTGLSAGAVRVYEELLALARMNGGRVYPSYDHLARATALGRATVARAIAALEAAGFLQRQRRFTRIAGEGAGPRYAQTSNAYRAMLPQRLLGLLPRWCRPAPVPPDALQHAADEAEAVAAMRARLSCRALAEASMGGALGRMLAKLGAGIDRRERESHRDPEPLSRVLDSRGEAPMSAKVAHIDQRRTDG